MALPVIANVWQCVFDWKAGSQTAKNVTYWQNTVGGNSIGLRDTLQANRSANMFAAVSDAAAAATVTIRKLDGADPPTGHAITGWAGVGGTDYIPGASQVLTLYTTSGGKSQRGRLYLPFLPESGQSDGLIIGDTATVVEPAWNTFLSAMSDDDWDLCVASLITHHTSTVHNSDGSVTRGVPGASSTPHVTVVTHLKANNVVATQRRRQSRLRRT